MPNGFAALVKRLARRRRRLSDDAVAPPTVDDVRRRLELVLTAIYERPFRVEGAAEPRPPSWIWRALGARRPAPPLATHDVAADVDTVRLPRTLDASDASDAGASLAVWRLLALEQAERAARRSAAFVPLAADPLERTLFALSEGACVDHALTRRTRAGAAAVRDARADALARRPPLGLLPAAERDVERLFRAVLDDGDVDDVAADARGGLPLPDADGAPDASIAWAKATAARLRAVHGDVFRAALPVSHWGELPELDAVVAERLRDARGFSPPLPVTGMTAERTSRDRAGADETLPDPEGGSHSAALDGPPPVDDRGALVLADDASSAATASSRVGSRAAPLDDVRTPRVGSTVPVEDAAGVLARIAYPEWDVATARHRPHGATVTVVRAPEGDGAWGDAMLRDHAAVVRRVRARFAPLRARRARLARQLRGDELDLAACVASAADRRAGLPGDDRLYVAVRPARRAIAIAILVDVSGSTDTPVAASLGRTDAPRIVDVEKEALLLAGEALDALGDPFTVLTFSSRGAHAVRVTAVKAFGERADATVRRRVAAIRPEGNTRLGAALRHATAQLVRQPAGHRLLLLLSDGRPNDADGYQGPRATEDARQAVLEARAAGVHPYCLSVDREEAEELAGVFGVGGYTALRHVEQLPLALVGAVRQLLGR